MIQRRLAWPTAQDNDYNEAVFEAAEEVVRWAWKHRHPIGYDSSNAEAKFGAPAMDAAAIRTLAT